MENKWRLVQSNDNISVYMTRYGGQIITIAKPQGRDWWNIYDTTGMVVEGASLGPFDNFEDAKCRVQKDIPIPD